MMTAEEFDEVRELSKQIETLREENVALRKMMVELEQEKCVMAHQFLTSALRMRVSMANPVGYIANRDKEKEKQQQQTSNVNINI